MGVAQILLRHEMYSRWRLYWLSLLLMTLPKQAGEETNQFGDWGGIIECKILAACNANH